MHNLNKRKSTIEFVLGSVIEYYYVMKIYESFIKISESKTNISLRVKDQKLA